MDEHTRGDSDVVPSPLVNAAVLKACCVAAASRRQHNTTFCLLFCVELQLLHTSRNTPSANNHSLCVFITSYSVYLQHGGVLRLRRHWHHCIKFSVRLPFQFRSIRRRRCCNILNDPLTIRSKRQYATIFGNEFYTGSNGINFLRSGNGNLGSPHFSTIDICVVISSSIIALFAQ